MRKSFIKNPAAPSTNSGTAGSNMFREESLNFK